MRVLCLLLVCFVAVGYALPPRYYAVPEQIDDDDDADVQDSPYFSSDDDMYTFPVGGPGGPPANRFISGIGGPNGGGRQARTENDKSYLGKYYFDYDTNVLYQGDDGLSSPLSPDVARQLLRMGEKKGAEVKEANEEEEATEDEEDQEDEEEDDDADDEPDYAVPDMSKLFPNPDNRPRGPGDYAAYVKHSPRNQLQRPVGRYNVAPSRPPPGRYNVAPPPGPPPRRYRFISPTGPYVNTVSDLYDTVVVDAADNDKSRILYDENVEEDEDQEDQEDDVDAADEAEDFSVPSFNTLFPTPDKKTGPNANLFGGVANTWNSARPPGRYGRVVRIFQSPLHHDVYNPDYVVDPVIAMNRRNERLKNRYSHPAWKHNVLSPYRYKPILYAAQRGHWGNPREHDYNPLSGGHYVGGIYNGKNYYPH